MDNDWIVIPKGNEEGVQEFKRLWSYYLNKKEFLTKKFFALYSDLDDNNSDWNVHLDIMECFYLDISKAPVPFCILDKYPLVDPYDQCDRASFVPQSNDWLERERGPVFRSFIAHFYMNHKDLSDPPLIDRIDLASWTKINNIFQNWIDYRFKIKKEADVSGLAFVSSDNYLLFSKTIYSRQYCFSFPGGSLSPGESRAACSVREFIEETGWDPTDGNPAEFIQRLEKKESKGIDFYISGKASNFWVVGSKTAKEFCQVQPVARPKEIKRLYWIHIKHLPYLINRKRLGSTIISHKILSVLKKMQEKNLF